MFNIELILLFYMTELITYFDQIYYKKAEKIFLITIMKEYTDKEPMHTAEHILNQTMVQTFGCKRAYSSHIERKKSKCDYMMSEAPSDVQIKAVEDKVNEVIKHNLPITTEFANRNELSTDIELDRLPEGTDDELRLVKVGDYDTCVCIGAHVENTSEIGEFKIISHDFEDGRLRLRFKLE